MCAIWNNCMQKIASTCRIYVGIQLKSPQVKMLDKGKFQPRDNFFLAKKQSKSLQLYGSLHLGKPLAAKKDIFVNLSVSLWHLTFNVLWKLWMARIQCWLRKCICLGLSFNFWMQSHQTHPITIIIMVIPRVAGVAQARKQRLTKSLVLDENFKPYLVKTR